MEKIYSSRSEVVRNKEDAKVGSWLIEIRNKVKDEMLEIRWDLRKKGSSTKELREKEQQMIAEFLGKMKKEAEQFKLIFETEKGSTYFISQDGQSLRFKKQNNGEFSIEPIMRKIFFVSRDEAKRLLEFKRDDDWQNKMVGFGMKKVCFAEGTVPVEMLSESCCQELFFEESDQIISIDGINYKNGSVADQFVAGIHIGHAVSRIWKK